MQEIEATLIICAEDPPEVAGAVAALPSVAGYPLAKRDSVSIHDYYVDTSDGALHHADFSFRLREANSCLWLTIKGPPRAIGPGIVEHLELELPWSVESLERIRQELACHEVKVPKLSGGNELDSPAEVLASVGLNTVQHRENHRQIRNVMPLDNITGPRLAELSIDSVVYHFERRRIRHYEVEIEAKSQAGIEALPGIVQGLEETYPATVQRWDHGKLSTGKAAEALLEHGALEGLINQQDQLMPAAYQKIHQFLSKAQP